MSLYVRSKVLFVGEPEVLERITREVEENGEAISFERILPLNGADPEEVWGVSGEAEETDRILYRIIEHYELCRIYGENIRIRVAAQKYH